MAKKTNLKTCLVTAIFLLVPVFTAFAGEIYVYADGTGDSPTIQAAIDATVDGDVVILTDGTFTGPDNRDIDFKGKRITVKSENGPESCIIDCQGTEAEPHRGFYFHSHETQRSILDGLTITGGYLTNSTGAGIYCFDSNPKVINCIFLENYSDGSGGGMGNYESSPTVSNCEFIGNIGSHGGGMDNDNSSPTLTNCTFIGNSVSHRGGGMFNYWHSDPKVTNCIFRGNWAYNGGGMENFLSHPTVTNCTFSGNVAKYGSGVENYDSSPTVTNCTFTGNAAGSVGGGMRNHSGRPTVVNCTFSGNSAGFGGGGMSNYDLSHPTVTNCTFSGNSAGFGGGMSNFWYSRPKVTNCTFRGNLASDDGGGMYNSSYSSPMLTNCTFSGNSAGFGGGMSNYDLSHPTVTNCTFSGNSAGFGGGGMANDRSSPTVTNCRFTGNSVVDDGGGMYNYHSSPTIANCTFSDNSAGDAGGGMNNVQYSNPTVTNCILWGDTAASDGNEIAVASSSTIAVNYCDVKGEQAGIYNDGTGTVNWGSGNIDADPMFFDAGYWDDNDVWVEGDYHLLPGSPCIDAGDNTAVPAGVTTDLDGNPRFVDQPEVPDTGNGTAPIVDMGAYEANYIEVAMRFTPQALNPGSQGNWVKAHFVLPDGFDVNDVDANTPAVIEPLGIESEYMNVFINEDGLVEIEAAFSRSDFCGSATSDDDTEVIVIGLLNSGQNFYGTDTIRIITHNLKYVAVFASHWLEANCGNPDWCSGQDLDQNSVVDFVDFAMFDGCCIEVIEE